MAREVIYMGKSICYQKTGVSDHPQFKHIKIPPSGYYFTDADTLADEKLDISLKKAIGQELNPREKMQDEIVSARRKRLDEEKEKLENYCKLHQISEAIYKRYFRVIDTDERGVQIPLRESVLAFLPSFLLDLQAAPWVIEIEDVITLFWPFIPNGQQAGIDIIHTEVYRLVEYLLSRDECMGIITHINSTAESVRAMFKADIAKKVRYIPIGIPDIGSDKLCNTYQKPYGAFVKIFFTSSWAQGNFEVRGGCDVLAAFDRLCQKYDNIKLVLKCRIPDELPQMCREVLKKHSEKIHIISGRLSDEEMDLLMKNVDIFLLPSARVHIVSLLNTMAHGIPVVVSDGWGLGEYVSDSINASVVKGRYGKTSWVDEEGILREDYESMYSVDEEFAQNLAEKIEELLLDEEYRYEITKNAIADLHMKYNLENWNEKLGEFFDECYSVIESKNAVDSEEKIKETYTI